MTATEQRTVCVVGTGIAGLSSAIAAVESHAQVVLVCSGELGAEGAAGELAGGNTRLAQGGVAASVGADDTAWAHRADTIAAGYGLVDMLAADRLTADGARIMQRLIGDGLAVDRGPDGLPALGLEAAHRRPRILHAGGDRTGAVLHAFLVQQLRRLVTEGRVTLLERSTATALIVREGAVVGLNVQEAGSHRATVTAASTASATSTAAAVSTVTADAVVLATGGYAALYPRTSNHLGARGEGIVLAARAGAAVADLEFVQFHPTALRTADAAGAFLVSEAVRGAGAVLRDGDGNRFMVPAHPAAELAPRDTVSREIDRVLRERGDAQVWLDATAIERDGGPGALAARFPSITAAVKAYGFDWRQEPIPVAPAAHYTMGGVATDLDARTSVPGLFAAGETASTGVHGANRLASNSLLEGLVFGARAGAAAATEPLAPARDELLRLVRDAEPESSAQPVPHLPASSAEAATQASGDDAVTGLDWSIDTELTAAGDLVGAALADGLGILRDADGIEAARNTCLSVPGPAGELGGLIAASAAARTESRGAHQRSDFPTTDPAQARRTAMFTRAPRAALQ